MAVILPEAAANWYCVQLLLQVPQLLTLPSSQTSGPFRKESPQYGPVSDTIEAQPVPQALQVATPYRHWVQPMLGSSQTSPASALRKESPQYGPVRATVEVQPALQAMQVGVPYGHWVQ